MSLASRSPVEPSFCPAAAIARFDPLDLRRDAARGLRPGAAEAVAGDGELRFHGLDLVAQRALDEAARLGQPLVGGDEDGLGLVDLAVERFRNGAPGAFQAVAGGGDRKLRFLELRGHGARHRLAGLAEMLDHRLGAGLQRGVDDFGGALDAPGRAVGLAGDELDDLFGPRAEPLDERFAVHRHRIVDPVAGRAEPLDHARCAVADGGVQAILRLAEARIDLLRLPRHGVGEEAARLAQVLRRLLATRRETARQRLARLVDLLHQPEAALRERLEGLAAGGFQPADEILAARDQRIGEALAGGGKPVEQRIAALAQAVRKLGGGLAEPGDDRIAVLGEGVGDGGSGAVEAVDQQVAAIDDRVGKLVARLVEALEQAFGARRELADDLLAGLADILRDGVAAAGQQIGDALGGAVGGDRDLVGDAGEVGGERLVRAADRLADPVGVLHDRLALRHQLVDEAADAQLVVGVGALQRSDLVVHQHLELARPRERALDAVAHGGDLAADRLADGDHGFLGDVLRLGEAERHFRHGARDHAHFLAAPDQHGHAPEQQDRADDADGEAEQLGRAAHVLDAAQAGDLVAPDADAEGGAEAEPDERQEKRRPERRVGRAPLQRIEQVADGADVVIGGAPRAGPFRSLAFGRAASLRGLLGRCLGNRILPRARRARS